MRLFWKALVIFHRLPHEFEIFTKKLKFENFHETLWYTSWYECDMSGDFISLSPFSPLSLRIPHYLSIVAASKSLPELTFSASCPFLLSPALLCAFSPHSPFNRFLAALAFFFPLLIFLIFSGTLSFSFSHIIDAVPSFSCALPWWRISVRENAGWIRARPVSV